MYQVLLKPSSESLIKAPDGGVAPFIVLTRDNGADQTVLQLENVFPVWQVMLKLNLDSVQIICYCPGNSKDHPVEQGNRSIKIQVRGHIISSGAGTAKDFQTAAKAAKDHLNGATHSGEPISVLLFDDSFQEFLIPYPVLHAFSKARKAFIPKCKYWYHVNFKTQKLSWKDQGMFYSQKFYAYQEIEDQLTLLQDHVTLFSIYCCFISRCNKNPSCEFCCFRDWRGPYDPRNRFEREQKCNTTCIECGCIHSLHKGYQSLIETLKTRTFKAKKKKRHTHMFCLFRNWTHKSITFVSSTPQPQKIQHLNLNI